MSSAYDCGTKTKMRRMFTCARVKSSVVPVVDLRRIDVGELLALPDAVADVDVARLQVAVGARPDAGLEDRLHAPGQRDLEHLGRAARVRGGDHRKPGPHRIRIRPKAVAQHE